MKITKIRATAVMIIIAMLSLAVCSVPVMASEESYPYQIQTPVMQYNGAEVYSLVDGGSVTAVNIKKVSENDNNAKVYVALYGGADIIDVATATIEGASWNVGEVKDIAIYMPLDFPDGADADDYMLRTFIFSEDLLPLVIDTVMSNQPSDSGAPTIWMAGDSLSATYRDNQRPQTGWMETFAKNYAPNLTIQNKAVGGYSSKSFYDEGKLTEILSSAESGDYLFVQFSHNDTHEGTENEYRYTQPGNWKDETKTTWIPSTYEDYMSKYIAEARAKGIKPVLVTSVAWAQYSGNTFTGREYRNMERYAEGARYLADLYHVPLVEVFEPTCEYHESTESAAEHKYYYMYVDVCSAESADDCVNKVRHTDWDHSWCANFTTAKTDAVHVNHKGAAWIAQIVADELFRLDLPLCDLIKRQPANPANGASIVFGEAPAEDEISYITYKNNYERTVYEGKSCIAIPDKSGLGIVVDDAVIGDATNAKLTIEYYYTNEEPYVDYTTANDGRKNTRLTAPSSSGWVTEEFSFKDLPFTTSNYDFSINNSSNGTAGVPIYVSQIKVEKVEEATPVSGASIVFGNGNDLNDVTNFMSTYQENFERTTYQGKASVAVSNNNSISFNIDDEVLGDSSSAAKLTIEYYDGGEAPYIGYYSSNGWKNALLETATGSGWKTVEFIFTELPFDASKNYNFRVNNSSSGDGSAIYVSQIKVEKVVIPDPADGASIVFGATAAENIENCMTYTASASCVNTTYYGKSCIKLPHYTNGSRDYLYFTLDDEVLGTGAKANVTITYFDAGVLPRLEYYNNTNANAGFKNPVFGAANSAGWKKVTITLEDLPFTDYEGRWNYDFRIRSNSSTSEATSAIYIAEIKVEKVEEAAQ